MNVAIRELKAQLSAYVKRAANGERITITDRGRPVASLGPPPGRFDLSAAIEAGWVQPASASGLRPLRRRTGRLSTFDALGEDRS